MPSASGALTGGAGGALQGFQVGGPIGALVGGGIGAITGLFGGGKSKLQKGLESKILPVADNLINWSGQANDARKALQPTGINSLNRAAGYYKGILSPNDTDAYNELVGPASTDINQRYENEKNTLARGIGPGGGARGGGRTSGMMNFEFQKNRDLLELVPQAKMMAAAGLSQVGSQASQAALGFGDQALRDSQAVLGTALPGSQQAFERSQVTGAEYGDLGNQLGTLLGPYLKDILAGMGKGGAAGKLVGNNGAFKQGGSL